MAFEFYKESYSGAVKQITLGKGDKAITVGGETCYPFYQFEGKMSCKPRIAMEVWDMKPEDWAATAVKPFEDVIDDPAAWAKKCVEEYGADMIALLLRSTDPNDKNAGPDQAVETVRKVREAVKVPLIVWGTASPQKDEEVLKKIAEKFQGEGLILGPVEDSNHKGIGAAAMGFGHMVISSSPIDVNLAKQVNILLENLGMPMNRVIIDPTTGGLGYGMEYSYSVMERLKMAAMVQGDDKLQFPVLNNLGFEIWKSKEAKQSAEEAPTLGDPERRGVLMESVGAVSYLLAGSDILILRHPESVRMVRSFIDLGMNGGSPADVAPVAKRMGEAVLDLSALSPKPDLTIAEEKKAEPVKAAAPKKAAEAAPKAAAPAPAPSAPAAAPVAASAPAAVSAVSEDAMRARLEAEMRAKIEAEMRIRMEQDSGLKAESEAKAAADAEKKAKAEADAKAAAEKEAREKAEAETAARIATEEAVIRKSVAAAREERIKALAEAHARKVAEAAVIRQTHLNTLVSQMEWVNRKV